MRFFTNFLTRSTALIALTAAFVSPLASAGLIQYDNWSGNVTADYHVTINDDTANYFTVHIQVDPGYQANVLAFGFNNGDRYNSIADLGFTAVSPNAASYDTGYPEFFFDTNDCAMGCNWNGVVSAFDTIIKLQSTGAGRRNLGRHHLPHHPTGDRQPFDCSAPWGCARRPSVPSLAGRKRAMAATKRSLP